MEWISINQARTETGPIPRRWRDGRSLEREEREEREPTSGERNAATKLGEKETLSFS